MDSHICSADSGKGSQGNSEKGVGGGTDDHPVENRGFENKGGRTANFIKLVYTGAGH